MLELRRPLSRIMDGPGLLIEKLTALTPNLDPHHIDDILLSLAESDPDYINYLNSEGLLRRPSDRRGEAWQS